MNDALHALATHGFQCRAPWRQRHGGIATNDGELGGRRRDGALIDAGERYPLRSGTERQTVLPGEIGAKPAAFLGPQFRQCIGLELNLPVGQPVDVLMLDEPLCAGLQSPLDLGAKS